MPFVRVNIQFELVSELCSVALKTTRTLTVSPRGQDPAERQDERLVVDRGGDRACRRPRRSSSRRPPSRAAIVLSSSRSIGPPDVFVAARTVSTLIAAVPEVDPERDVVGRRQVRTLARSTAPGTIAVASDAGGRRAGAGRGVAAPRPAGPPAAGARAPLGRRPSSRRPRRRADSPGRWALATSAGDEREGGRGERPAPAAIGSATARRSRCIAVDPTAARRQPGRPARSSGPGAYPSDHGCRDVRPGPVGGRSERLPRGGRARAARPSGC